MVVVVVVVDDDADDGAVVAVLAGDETVAKGLEADAFDLDRFGVNICARFVPPPDCWLCGFGCW